MLMVVVQQGDPHVVVILMLVMMRVVGVGGGVTPSVDVVVMGYATPFTFEYSKSVPSTPSYLSLCAAPKWKWNDVMQVMVENKTLVPLEPRINQKTSTPK
jgi:hypothetical protein